MVSFRTERDVEANLLRPLFHEVLGYPDKDLEWARRVRFQLGREVRYKEADLVVNYRKKPVITVEAKKPTEPVRTALSQADSYAFALSTPYSVITNGKQLVLRGYYSFNSKINIVDESVDNLLGTNWHELTSLISRANIAASIKDASARNIIEEPDEEKIKDYRRFFRRIHNAIRDRDRLDPAAAFDELSKLLFLKASEDEWRSRNRSRPVLTPEKIEEWEQLGRGIDLVNEWFRSATDEVFPGVFEQPRITLSTESLKEVLGMLAPFHVKNGEVDVKGRAFEEFLPSQLRGEGLGQYFTPRPIVNFMAALAGISIHDTVVDFACGSGGFLIKAFEHMKARVEELPDGTLRRLGVNREQILDDIRERHIFGVDAEPRAARTAKMNMLMWGDGRRVVRGNALAETDMNGKPYAPAEYDEKDPESGCTVILANPPFGSKEKDQHVLKRYVLGSKNQERKSEKTEILFIEKGLNLLRPEGRMLIVLPENIFAGRKYEAVRNFIHARAEVRAIISLPTHTFVQSGVPTVNTCVVYFQRFTKEKEALYAEATRGMDAEQARQRLREDPAFDYPIFMATSEYIGYEPSGRSIVQEGEQTDLDLILADFDLAEIPEPDTDLFEFAAKHYGEKTTLRREQTIRGTKRGLKTSFVVNFHDIEDRLDPAFHFFRRRAGALVETFEPLKGNIRVLSDRFTPKTDDELDREYPILSVSSDGKITINKYLKGEDFTQSYKRVTAGDIVYNPSRINIGSIGVVPHELDGCYSSPEYVVFRPLRWNSEFLVSLMRSPFYRMYIDIVATGSIRDRVLKAELETIRVPAVSAADQATVEAEVGRVDDHVAQSVGEIADEKAELVDLFRKLLLDAADMDRIDARIARDRLDAVVADPTQLVEGDELSRELAAMNSQVADMTEEDAIDLDIARRRLSAIAADPSQLVEGEELEDALREIMQ